VYSNGGKPVKVEGVTVSSICRRRQKRPIPAPQFWLIRWAVNERCSTPPCGCHNCKFAHVHWEMECRPVRHVRRRGIHTSCNTAGSKKIITLAQPDEADSMESERVVRVSRENHARPLQGVVVSHYCRVASNVSRGEGKAVS
jgi:hypothetical protein